MSNPTRREYKTISEVVLKPNQVLLKPIRPLSGRGVLTQKIKSIMLHVILLAACGISVYMIIAGATEIKVGGGVLLGTVMGYVITLLKR